MVIKKTIVSLILTLLLGLAFAAPVLAFPPLPSSFYGTVQINGKDIPEGTLVRALVDGVPSGEARTQIYEGHSVYSINVNGDDASTEAVEGGKESSAIRFEVGGNLAAESGVWQSGTNVNLDLSVKSAAAVINTPPPTIAPPATQTPLAILIVTSAAAPVQIEPGPTSAKDPAPTLPCASGFIGFGIVVSVLILRVIMHRK